MIPKKLQTDQIRHARRADGSARLARSRRLGEFPPQHLDELRCGAHGETIRPIRIGAAPEHFGVFIEPIAALPVGRIEAEIDDAALMRQRRFDTRQ